MKVEMEKLVWQQNTTTNKEKWGFQLNIPEPNRKNIVGPRWAARHKHQVLQLRSPMSQVVHNLRRLEPHTFPVNQDPIIINPKLI